MQTAFLYANDPLRIVYIISWLKMGVESRLVHMHKNFMMIQFMKQDHAYTLLCNSDEKSVYAHSAFLCAHTGSVMDLVLCIWPQRPHF